MSEGSFPRSLLLSCGLTKFIPTKNPFQSLFFGVESTVAFGCAHMVRLCSLYVHPMNSTHILGQVSLPISISESDDCIVGHQIWSQLCFLQRTVHQDGLRPFLNFFRRASLTVDANPSANSIYTNIRHLASCRIDRFQVPHPIQS